MLSQKHQMLLEIIQTGFLQQINKERMSHLFQSN
jgi:hypothetical protein